MIPKVIHYCWFGYNQKPKLAEKCIKSWSKYCPDFEIREWNEGNFDIGDCPLYVQQAYAEKKWAFVTDYVRLKIIFEHGGIYLDTDVELIRSLDPFTQYEGFFGFETPSYVATGLGFGAMKELPILKELMDDYNDIPFILPDGTYDLKPCPQRNISVFKKHGLNLDGRCQVIDNNIKILSPEYLCPINFDTEKKTITENTYAIHWFSASWKTDKEKKSDRKEKRAKRRVMKVDYIMHIPNQVLRLVLGNENYQKLKRIFKRY